MILIENMEELMMKLHEFHTDIKDEFISTLDSRGVGGSEFQTNQIIEAIKASTVAMCTSIRNNPSAKTNISLT